LALHDACQNGDIETLKKRLSQGGDINERDGRQRTPLFMACENGHLDRARLLIENAADKEAMDLRNLTPLHHACSMDISTLINY